MLTTESYYFAIVIYCAAAVAGVAMLRALWFVSPLSRGSAALLGLVAGLLLVPAFPSAEVTTVAPALIVVIFNALFGDGIGSATVPALWLLGGAVCGALAGLYWRRWRLRADR
ncbi:MAG: hypothetical protein P8M73_09420 [Luminiphilus sp.]|jgi:hypothetical protein|nr:hypothetical protein [Luminiphilus sp.]